MTTRKAHGPAIRAIRKLAGVSQDELAITAGISPSHLHRIETGERAASAQVITAISTRLGITEEAITYTVQSTEPIAA